MFLTGRFENCFSGIKFKSSTIFAFLALQGRVTETLTVIESHLATDSDLSLAIIQLFMR